MASREKVRRFLEESEAYKHYSNIVECALTYFIAKAEKEGNSRFADDLREAQRGYHEAFQKGVDVTEEVYAETFTDEELDDLIILGGNPALKKARQLTSDIFDSIVKHYAAVSA
jgi:hypothetical protein